MTSILVYPPAGEAVRGAGALDDLHVAAKCRSCGIIRLVPPASNVGRNRRRDLIAAFASLMALLEADEYVQRKDYHPFAGHTEVPWLEQATQVFVTDGKMFIIGRIKIC